MPTSQHRAFALDEYDNLTNRHYLSCSIAIENFLRIIWNRQWFSQVNKQIKSFERINHVYLGQQPECAERCDRCIKMYSWCTYDGHQCLWPCSCQQPTWLNTVVIATKLLCSMTTQKSPFLDQVPIIVTRLILMICHSISGSDECFCCLRDWGGLPPFVAYCRLHDFRRLLQAVQQNRHGKQRLTNPANDIRNNPSVPEICCFIW